ncbi:hypothetical protein ZIOFF_068986 [Zingiber officinale]|uniref:Uncharacterized protein n=1 Tax=Zingiber officinale TaxID=94328 RepID=A0A8J5C5D1_ZINOF|nr:hypothetical protein ZIOFF_068986 [Zingiber officinale]
MGARCERYGINSRAGAVPMANAQGGRGSGQIRSGQKRARNNLAQPSPIIAGYIVGWYRMDSKLPCLTAHDHTESPRLRSSAFRRRLFCLSATPGGAFHPDAILMDAVRIVATKNLFRIGRRSWASGGKELWDHGLSGLLFVLPLLRSASSTLPKDDVSDKNNDPSEDLEHINIYGFVILELLC